MLKELYGFLAWYFFIVSVNQISFASDVAEGNQSISYDKSWEEINKGWEEIRSRYENLQLEVSQFKNTLQGDMLEAMDMYSSFLEIIKKILADSQGRVISTNELINVQILEFSTILKEYESLVYHTEKMLKEPMEPENRRGALLLRDLLNLILDGAKLTIEELQLHFINDNIADIDADIEKPTHGFIRPTYGLKENREIIAVLNKFKNIEKEVSEHPNSDERVWFESSLKLFKVMVREMDAGQDVLQNVYALQNIFEVNKSGIQIMQRGKKLMEGYGSYGVINNKIADLYLEFYNVANGVINRFIEELEYEESTREVDVIASHEVTKQSDDNKIKVDL